MGKYVSPETQEHAQSQLANGMKQNATPEQLLCFADWVRRTYAEQQST